MITHHASAIQILRILFEHDIREMGDEEIRKWNVSFQFDYAGTAFAGITVRFHEPGDETATHGPPPGLQRLRSDIVDDRAVKSDVIPFRG